ncbi:DHHA1 domain-containing protein [Intestinibaculum porci]
MLNGRGGGKPDIAQGGAPTLDAIEDAKEAVKAKL